jgi:hypothetical protein
MTRILIFLVIIMLGSETRISACICMSQSSSFKEDMIRLHQLNHTSPDKHYIFKGIVTEYLPGNEGGRFKVLEQYFGTIGVIQNTITIRNGDGIGCLGGIRLNSLGDTLIASVYRISANFNPYQQPPLYEGEFVTDLCLWSYMPVHNDSVYGWGDYPDPGLPLSNLKDSIDHFFNNLLSIGDNDNDQNVSIDVYPNPAGDLVYVQTSGTNLLKAMLYDVSGRCLIIEPVISGRAVINMQQLSPGTYLVKVAMDDGKTMQKKIIKQ